MSSRFLCLSLLVVLVVVSVAVANDEENNFMKRDCLCHGKSGVFYFFNKEGCPTGLGYTGFCKYELGTCCYT
uniref:mRNA n=1 Tax=Oulactis sp. TaxID=2093647 RepID=A0A4D8XNA6_OULSP|nr:mRNA [Oulactis sp. MM-2018]